MKRQIFTWFGLTAFLCASAADVAFTGANGTDLADAANWAGGVVPGEGDIGVVDVAASGTDYSVSTNCFIGGLSFVNNASTPVLTSDQTLTLGTGGITCGSTGGITFKLPLGVAGTQTWTFGKGPTKFYKTISGTDPLTITQAKGVWHYYSPRYDGKISYTSITEWNNSGWSQPTAINFYEPNCKWANEIVVSCAVRFLFAGSVDFKVLFPGMSPLALGSGSFGIEAVGDEGGAGGAGYPTLYVTEGETISMKDFLDGAGDVHQTGGSLDVSGVFVIANRWFYNYWYGRPSHYYLEAGTIGASNVKIGEYGKGVHRMVQSGGTLSVSSQLLVGGGNQTEKENLAEYFQSGGDVTVTATTVTELNNTGTALYYPEDQWGAGRALYEMKGGTHTTPRILFGRNYDANYITRLAKTNGSVMPADNSYGLFELAGGTLSVGAGGIVTGHTWNPEGWVDEATNCFADVRLLGGTIKTTATSPTTVPLQFPHAGQSLDWETSAGTTHTVFAPVYGKGELVKKGAGELSLTDATAFKGSVKVQEGSLRLLGKGATPGEDLDCWQWTADAVLAAGATNGERIATWSDLRHGVAATNTTIHLSTRGDVAYDCPQVKANVFNGHAALYFNSSMLAVPADLNPLVGANEMTIAFVFKETTDSWAKLGAGNYYAENTHMMNPGWGYYNNAWGPWFQWGGGNRLQFMVDSGASTDVADHIVTTTEGVSLRDGIHVAVATISEQSGLSLTVDGIVTNRPWTGTYRPLFQNKSSKVALPLVIGCLFGDSDNARKMTGMNIAELRFYTNELSRAEVSDLVFELGTKYNASQTAASQIVAGYADAVAGELVSPVSPTIPELPVPTQCWTADSLAETLADGAEVTSWATTAGKNVLSVESGFAAPTFVADSANGHAAVRFDAARRTTLSAKASAALTKNDWNNWTMAVVFRAAEGATGRTGVMEGRGIVSVMKDETSNNCFQFAMVTNGEVRAFATTGKYVFQRRPLHLDDGEVHVAVFTSDMIYQYNGKQVDILVVDGVVNCFEPFVNPELAKTDAFNFRLGQLVNGKGLFSGEILEVRWYNQTGGKTLTMTETIGVCSDLAKKYGVRMYDRGNFGVGKVAAYGLGATNVSVAADAQLILPLAQTTPYTVGAGQTLEVAGTVKGTLAMAEGGVLRIPYGALPSIESLKASGSVTLDVVDLPQQSSRRKFTPIATVGSADLDGSTWTVAGEKRSSATAEVRDGVLGVCTISGLTIIFR